MRTIEIGPTISREEREWANEKENSVKKMLLAINLRLFTFSFLFFSFSMIGACHFSWLNTLKDIKYIQLMNIHGFFNIINIPTPTSNDCHWYF